MENVRNIKDKLLRKVKLRVRKFGCFVLTTQTELERHTGVEAEKNKDNFMTTVC